MKFLRVKITIGRMMTAVAVIGVACGYVALERRASSCRSLGQQFAVKAMGESSIYSFAWRNDPSFGEPASPDKDTPRDRRLRYIQHLRDQAKKYERAAKFPWLPIAPDPPMPAR